MRVPGKSNCTWSATDDSSLSSAVAMVLRTARPRTSISAQLGGYSADSPGPGLPGNFFTSPLLRAALHMHEVPAKSFAAGSLGKWTESGMGMSPRCDGLRFMTK